MYKYTLKILKFDCAQTQAQNYYLMGDFLLVKKKINSAAGVLGYLRKIGKMGKDTMKKKMSIETLKEIPYYDIKRFISNSELSDQIMDEIWYASARVRSIWDLLHISGDKFSPKCHKKIVEVINIILN